MLMADIGATLATLNLPEDVIREVMQMLEENASALEQAPLNPIGDSVFGASSWGSQLAFDANLAQQEASKEIMQQVAGLRGYRDSMAKFAEDVTATDESNAEAMARMQAATSCVAAPTFSAPAQCTLPTEGSDS